MVEELRDIKDVWYILDIWTLLFFLLLAGSLVAVGYFLFRYLKQKKRWAAIKPPTPLPVKPFDQAALDALAAIDPIWYFEKRKIKEFYFVISDVVRKFLAGNYRIDTLDKTSLEIVEEIERIERDFEKIKKLDRFFSECDLVKFAKLRPGLVKMKQKKVEAEKIVEKCKRKV